MPSLPATPAIRAPRWLAPAFFGGLLLLGAWLVTDYGVSWDEPVDHLNGLVSLRHITTLVAPEWAARQPLLQQVPPLAGYVDNDHGVLFELPLALLHTTLRSGSDLRTYYLWRHMATFVVCVGGIWALYRLALLRFRNQYVALFTALLFVLSPRMFAESFYNAKDLVFLAAFTLGMYTLARLLERPTPGRALVHGLASAVALDIRILGSMLVPFTLVLLLLEAIQPTQQRLKRARLGASGAVYLLSTVGAGIAGWPYLWAAPLDNFLQAFEAMRHFRWQGKVLYWGEYESAQDLPWHYAPVWLLVTTPLSYSLAALGGLLLQIRQVCTRPRTVLGTYTGRLDLLFCGWLLGPMILVIGMNSVLYDGWRHLYFVYPALLLLAVGAGVRLWRWAGQATRRRRIMQAAAGAVTLEMAFTAVRMALMHPQQQVYFSFLPTHKVEQWFERDYWGLSYRQGLEYLARTYPQGPILVDPQHIPPFENNRALLPPADRQRFVVSETAPGRFLLLDYRSQAGTVVTPTGWEVYRVTADGLPILSIYQHP
ncbi:glycosyltransferase family 39 protein [Hymenobacter sp. UYP22]|uniref:glycosyltransferase family 39 protein n=1 Tax=Hymenobacter sp. UYP22 TaxID=3156348 RepID=UPI00339B4784